MKNILIIRTPKGYRYCSMIADEIRVLGENCYICEIDEAEKILKERKLSPQNTIIHTRTAHPGKVYQVLRRLNESGYKVINNPETVKLTSQKFLSCVHMEKNNLPCAKTLKMKKNQAPDFVRKNLKKWKKIIVKPITSKGQGEYAFCFDEKNLHELENISTILLDEVICQKYVDYTRLNRVIVIGFKALKGAVFYDEPGSGWKCSVCLNPNIKHDKNPPSELLKLAEKSAKIFNGEVFFIDIFTTPKGLVLNEINTACSLILHQKISSVNIAAAIAKRLAELAHQN